MPFLIYKIMKVHEIELILRWIQLIFHISYSSLVNILLEYYWKNTDCTYVSSVLWFIFLGVIEY